MSLFSAAIPAELYASQKLLFPGCYKYTKTGVSYQQASSGMASPLPPSPRFAGAKSPIFAA